MIAYNSTFPKFPKFLASCFALCGVIAVLLVEELQCVRSSDTCETQRLVQDIRNAVVMPL